MADSGTRQVTPAPARVIRQPLTRRAKIGDFIRNNDLVQYLFIIFICSYFIVPFEKLYKYPFYLSVFLFLFSVRRSEIVSACRSWVLRACALWLGYLTLTLLWTQDVQIRDIDDVIRGFILVLLFFIVMIHITSRDERFFAKLFLSLSLVSALTAIISIAIFYLGAGSELRRLVHFGVLDHPVSAALCYGVVGLITLYGRSSHGRAASGHFRWLYLGVAAAVFAFVFLTATRGALLGLSCAMIIGSILSRRWWVVLALLLAGLAVMAAGSWTEFGPYDFFARGSSYRIELWSIVLERIDERFWFGSGISADASMVLSDGYMINHSHQLFLGNHFYGGVPATLLLLSTIAIAARAAYRRYRLSGDVLCVTLLAYIVVIGLFDIGEFLRSPNLIWIYFWFPIVIIAAQERSADRDPQPAA